MGLGRFGDALNPWGDILSIARAWCVTKSGADMYLGLPTGTDLVKFNSHRQYGPVRWGLVTTNWLQVDHEEHTKGDFTDEFADGAMKTFEGLGFIFKRINRQIGQMIFEQYGIESGQYNLVGV
uniref:Uncharacterized protein n=1 Tax=Proboscia inermis TaxID=420281 RepID=A0A7S0CKK0_9STRA|mmetsp:Transcript_50629/g.51014  ORF Transcript_50629/g.51014 Transcript_50629/m.51014 type:complete len:123 (+) Transcript_50629:76-444(+)